MHKFELIIALGGISALIYLYLLLVKKSSYVKRLSNIVVFGLILLAVVGALIKYSQIYDQEFTLEIFKQMIYFALLLPSAAVGIAMVKVIGTLLLGIIAGTIEQSAKNNKL